MANVKALQKSEAGNVVGAGAAGGGLGTIIAALADRMPATADYKSLLTVSAPLVTIGISGLWLFMKTVYIDPYANNKKHRSADAAMEKILADARANLKRVEEDASSSGPHKAKLRKMVEDLEQLRLQKIAERMEVVVAD